MDGNTDQRLLESMRGQPHIRIGEVATAKIVEIKRHGARLRLPSGEDAWLPAKEWFPDIKPHESLLDAAFHRRNDTINVVVYDEAPRGSRHEKFVSVTRVEADPWDAVPSWPDGIIKAMKVELVTGDRALGDIATGIRGQVLLDTLKGIFTPEWRHHAPIRPGDKIAGFVARRAVDTEQRIVTLDVAGFIKSNVRVDKLLTSGALPLPHLLQPEDWLSTAAQFRPHVVTAVKRLLLVDDDLELLEEVPQFLQGPGCEVIRCSSVAKALAWLKHEKESVDVALIDLHLGDHRYGGLHVAAAIQAEQPDVSLVLITADDTIYTDTSFAAAEGVQDLKFCGVVLKPFGSEGLLRALAASSREPRRLIDLLTGRGPSRRAVPRVGSRGGRLWTRSSTSWRLISALDRSRRFPFIRCRER